MDVWLLLKSDYCILWYYTVLGLQKVHLKPVWVFVACECSYPAWDRSHKSRKFAVCTYLMNSAYHISCWSNIAFLWKYLEIINLNQSRTSQEPIKNPFWRLWSDLRFANKENFSRLSTSVHSGHLRPHHYSALETAIDCHQDDVNWTQAGKKDYVSATLLQIPNLLSRVENLQDMLM